ncbi:MAG: iron ABC transporter permease [Armatimonadota bacterium]|nr:iron ABC transporter permease [Armatimonadota bacterium]
MRAEPVAIERTRAWGRPAGPTLDPLRVLEVLTGAFLIAFLIVPIGAIVVDSAALIARGGLWEFPDFVGYLVRLTRNSLVVASIVTVICVAVSLPLAVLVGRVLPAQRLLPVALTLPLLAPPFVYAFATIILFGRVGVITQLLAPLGIRMPEIYGLPGIVVTHVLHLIPLSYLTIAAGLRTVPKAIEECAISLGSTPMQVLVRIVLPYISSYVFMASLLVFLASFGDVGAPLLVGGQYLVLPTEAFTRFTSFIADRRVPVLLSSWIVAISVVILVVVRALMRRTAIVHTFGVETYTYAQPSWRVVGAVFCWGIAAVLFVPYLVIFVSSLATVWGPDLLPKGYTLNHYQALWRSVEPLRNSLLVSGLATPIAVMLAVVIGRMMRDGGRLGAALDYVTLLPFVVSGVVVGIGLVRVYSPLDTLSPVVPLITGPALLVVAMVSRRVSYPMRVLAAAYTRIDRSLEESSLSLGASPATTFWRITLPQLAPAIVAALIITFIQIIKELGATLIVYRPGWVTLPVQIYAYALEGNLGRAGAVSMVLLAIVAAGTAAAGLLGRRTRGEVAS